MSDARHQLRQPERLTHEVDGALVEAVDHGTVIVDTRQHDDRDLDVFSSPSIDDLETEQPWHQLIEYDQVDVLRYALLISIDAIDRRDHFVAGALESGLEKGRNRRRVVCYEYALGRGHFDPSE